jgi:hypothetical protein
MIFSVQYSELFAKNKIIPSIYLILQIIYFICGIVIGHWVYRRFKQEGGIGMMNLGGGGNDGQMR